VTGTCKIFKFIFFKKIFNHFIVKKKIKKAKDFVAEGQYYFFSNKNKNIKKNK